MSFTQSFWVRLVGNLMRGTAIQHGERTEMKWSIFNKLSARLKGMGKAARYAAIDYWWNGENLRQDVRSLLPRCLFHGRNTLPAHARSCVRAA
jgi:hypothetical protein